MLCVSFGPDGSRVLTAGDDGIARLWDLRAAGGLAGRIPIAAEQTSMAEHAAFSADGRRVLLVRGDGTARVCDAVTGNPVGPPIRNNKGWKDAWLSGNGKRVLALGNDHASAVWDADTAKQLLSPAANHAKEINNAAISPDGKCAITISDDLVHMWQPDTGKPIALVPEKTQDRTSLELRVDGSLTADDPPDKIRRKPHKVHEISMTKDSFYQIYLVSKQFDTFLRLEDSTGKQLAEDDDSGGDLNALIIFNATKDDTYRIIATSYRGLGPYTLTVKKGATVDDVQLPVRTTRMRYATFSEDSQRVATLNSNQSVQVWETRTGKPVGRPFGNRVTFARFHLDGQRILTISEDNQVRIWDALTGLTGPTALAPRVLIQAFAHKARLVQAALSNNGRRLATACEDGTAWVWDIQSARVLAGPFKHENSVTSASFSADAEGRYLVTASRDRTVKIWDVDSEKLLAPPLPHHLPVTFAALSPDGKRVLTICGDGFPRTWDLSPQTDVLDLLLPLGQLHGGQRFSEAGRLIPLDAEFFKKSWQRTAECRIANPVPAEFWHAQGAEESQSAKQWYAAAWHLDRLLKMQPNASSLLSRRASVFAELGDFQAALDTYRKALEAYGKDQTLDPKDARANWEIALVYRRRGIGQEEPEAADRDFQKCRDLLRSMPSDHPWTWQALDELASSYFGLGKKQLAADRDAALDYYRKSQQMLEGLPANYQSALIRKRDLASSFESLGRDCVDSGKLELARQSFLNSVELWKKLETEPEADFALEERASLCESLADVSRKLGKMEEALKYYQEAVKFASTSPGTAGKLARLYGNLGDLCLELGKQQQALDYFHKAVKTNESRLESDPSAAVKDNLAAAYFRLARAYLKSNDRKNAEKYFQESREICEKQLQDTDAQNRYLAFRFADLGDLSLEFKRPKEAPHLLPAKRRDSSEIG